MTDALKNVRKFMLAISATGRKNSELRLDRQNTKCDPRKDHSLALDANKKEPVKRRRQCCILPVERIVCAGGNEDQARSKQPFPGNEAAGHAQKRCG